MPRAPNTRRASRRRVEFGDWQTPDELARSVVERLAETAGFEAPTTVVEPTCGRGNFLVAAAARWPRARLRGYEINAEHLAAARSKLGADAELREADVFTTNWERVFADDDGPLLVLGNPPWVTSAELGALGSANLPDKRNFKGLAGLDALTGRANFDVCEWTLLRLLHALVARGRPFTLAMLCKSLVARRIMEQVGDHGWALAGELRAIDAGRHFDASVDATLLILRGPSEAVGEPRWPCYASLDAERPSRTLALVDGTLTTDLAAYERTRSLAGSCDPPWRSGLKHDCAAVMEFRLGPEQSPPEGLEPDYLFPLLKGSDLANQRWPPTRAVLVPQRRLGEDTAGIAARAPKTWAYLQANAAALDARKSSIYAGRPRFSVFGVGPYSFAPWKVAIAGLYKQLRFVVVGPHELFGQARPVLVDDTCYFLPFADEGSARAAHALLSSEPAREFFAARVFWQAKRPITKRALQALDLAALRRALADS